MLFYHTIRKKYYYAYRDSSGTRKQISCKTANRDLAQLFVSAFEKQNSVTDNRRLQDQQAAVAAPQEQLLSEFTREYLEFIEGMSFTRSAIQSNRSTLALLLARIGDIPINSITVEQCEKFISIGQPSLETSAKHYGHLKAIFGRAKKWKRVVDNPFDHIPKPKPKEKLPDVFTIPEFNRLLHSMPLASFADRRLKRIVSCARDTGMRLSELLYLTIPQIDFDNRRLYVIVSDEFTPKSKKPRAIMLSDIAIQCLKDQIEENRLMPNSVVSDSSLVFPSLRGKVLTKCAVSDDFKKHVKQLFPDRPRLRFHSLRHTFGSLLVERNVPLARIQKLMGHSTIKMTEKYARLRSDEFEDALAAINSLDTGT